MKSEVIWGNAIEVIMKMYDESVDMIFTSPSPPHFEKDENMIGGEKHIDSYLANLGILFHECKRVLKKTGSLWVQMGSYHNIHGDLLLTPEFFLLQMVRGEEYHLKSKLIWHRTNDLPYQEDYNRFARNWEHLFFFTKERDGYYFNNPNNTKLSSVISAPYKSPRRNHFESGFPEQVVKTAIFRTCPIDGTIMDPLAGTGTTGAVAKEMNRGFVLVEIDEMKCYGIKGRLGIK